jgi:hypothetical protein
VLALVVHLSARDARGAEIIDRVLASVGSAIITQSDVAAALRLGLVKTAGAADPVGAAVERLIERRLTLNEVERYGPPEPTGTAIDQRLTAIRSAFAPARFQVVLEESGLTLDHLRRYVRDELRIATYLDQRFGSVIQPSEPEILAYYERHPGAFTRAGVVRPFDDAHDAAREALIADRRTAVIADWVSGLRKRADVSVLPR